MIAKEMHLTGSNSTTSSLELPRGYCTSMRTRAWGSSIGTWRQITFFWMTTWSPKSQILGWQGLLEKATPILRHPELSEHCKLSSWTWYSPRHHAWIHVSVQSLLTETELLPILCSGYMAPEYVMHGRVSPKIDVFSFGVLVLEIVTRRSNCSSDDHSTVNLLSDVSEVPGWLCFPFLFLLHLRTKRFIPSCLNLEALSSFYWQIINWCWSPIRSGITGRKGRCHKCFTGRWMSLLEAKRCDASTLVCCASSRNLTIGLTYQP